MHAAELLIHNLDDNGFFREPPEVAAPDIEPRTIERAQRLVQGLDPVGTCVADYRESLIVQIRHHESPAPHAAAVVEAHLDGLERGRFDEIARALDIPVAAVHAVLAFVRTLEPLPGRNFQSEPTRYVIPDATVRVHDGELAIVLNDEVIPVLGFDSFFERIGSDGVANNGMGGTPAGREARRFAKANLQEARSFIRNVAARNRSLVRVTRTVVDRQREFFRRGPKQLRPLTLRDVAEEVGLHEATISRIVNGKFVQTEWGIYELRDFFTNSISGAGSRGSQYSKAGVKEVVAGDHRSRTPGRQALVGQPHRRHPGGTRHQDRPPYGRQVSWRIGHRKLPGALTSRLMAFTVLDLLRLDLRENEALHLSCIGGAQASRARSTPPS